MGYFESWGYPTLRAIPAIYGLSALYMVVMQRGGRLPRKSIISLWSFVIKTGLLDLTLQKVAGLHNFQDFLLICLICDHINPCFFIDFNPPL